MKIKTKENALLMFEEAAIKHAEATETGDYKTGNKCYTTIAKTISYLKDHDSIIALAEFLEHPSVGVRGWAATYLLPVSEKKAIEVLQEIAKTAGIHSLGAELALTEWRKGTLNI